MKKFIAEKPNSMFKYSGSTVFYDNYEDLLDYLKESSIFKSDYFYVETVDNKYRGIAYKLDFGCFLDDLLKKVKILKKSMEENKNDTSMNELNSLVELVSSI